MIFLDWQPIPLLQCLQACLQTLETELALLASSCSHVAAAFREMGALTILLRCPHHHSGDRFSKRSPETLPYVLPSDGGGSECRRHGATISGRRAATFGMGPLGVLQVCCTASRGAKSVRLPGQVMIVMDGGHALSAPFQKPACHADVISTGLGRNASHTCMAVATFTASYYGFWCLDFA